jgi:UDP-N-acetylmuramoyl-tripeptide--D-alanyl-D-alanine ligase
MIASEKKRLQEILEGLDSMEIKGISIDSRSIKEGELFVAIKGDRFDGHDFIPDAMKRGAWGALVERAVLEKKYVRLSELKNILPVENTLYALQEMAHLNRKKFSLPVVGITGSNGKTTTKEMLAGIFRQQGPVLKNEGNLNNHIGVPLTLLGLNASHKAAVVEMGMSAPGEIDTLARLVKPTIGVITNIGPAHLEFFGSLEKIALAKGELLGHIQTEGVAVLNADDQFCGLLNKKTGNRVVTFGIENKADVRAADIRQGEDFTDFILDAEGSGRKIRLRTIGRHNIYNALAAAAAALAAGLPAEAVKYGLDDFAPVAMRSEIKQLQGRTVFADYYNANPASMEAALEVLVSMKSGKKAVAVLGDMLELGTSSAEAHMQIGKKAALLGVDIVIAVGELSKRTAEGAREAGMPREHVFETQAHHTAADLLRTVSSPGDIVLIKGSRGMKMEKILEEF